MASFSAELRTLPNLITLSRIVLLLVSVIFCTLTPWPIVGLILGVVAGVTDYLDGWLARRLNQVTQLGAILDQFSDLVFESAALILLVSYAEGPPALVLFIYLLREFWVTTIRRFLSSHGVEIQSHFSGKLKTNVLGWSFMFYFAYVAHLWPAAETFLIGIG